MAKVSREEFIRRRIAETVDKLAGAIERGDCHPTAKELAALADVCDSHALRAEATRVRRWIGGTT